MENIYFQVYSRPVVDREKNPKYQKIRVVKIKGNHQEELTKGQLLTFISQQFEKLQNHIEKGERFLIELPLDFLLSRSLIEDLELSKVNFLLENPVSHLTKKRIFHIKDLLKTYRTGGLEISFRSEVYEKYRPHFPPQEVAFVCLPPEEGQTYHRNCYREVNSEELFRTLKGKGELFCGRLFGDYRLVSEINALSYLKTTVSRALELLEFENVKIEELVQVIKTDPKLAVSLVKYANSPLIAPPSPIKDTKHSLVYLGLNRLKQFLLVIMLGQMAVVDPSFEKVALRLAAVGLLMEKRGKGKGLPYSACQLFLSGVIFESARLFEKSLEQVLDLIEVPKTCPLPLEDKRIRELYEELNEVDIEKMVAQLKQLLV